MNFVFVASLVCLLITVALKFQLWNNFHIECGSVCVCCWAIDIWVHYQVHQIRIKCQFGLVCKFFFFFEIKIESQLYGSMFFFFSYLMQWTQKKMRVLVLLFFFCGNIEKLWVCSFSNRLFFDGKSLFLLLFCSVCLFSLPLCSVIEMNSIIPFLELNSNRIRHQTITFF